MHIIGSILKQGYILINPKRIILLLLLSSFCFTADASHIVGGELTYQHIGDSGIYHLYQVNLSIYEDCITGSLSAIQTDNPAYLGVYSGMNFQALVRADSAFYSTTEQVPTGFSNSCIANVQKTCLTKKTFQFYYALPPSPYGYLLAYQRCCRNISIINILDPSGTGSTFYCTIPPSPIINNSAVFKNYPPQIICLKNPLGYDHSATDADGDSLSYEFCTSVTCCMSGMPNIVKPWPPSSPDIAPPVYYDSVIYLAGFTSHQPMTGYPSIQINPVTGLITGTPNFTGRYLVTVCCHEWRNGVMINTIKREFQFVVTNCSKVVVANIPQFSGEPNTYMVNCTDYTIPFVNTSTGGFAYHWDFGVPGTLNDTSNAFEPTYIYPDTGTYTVSLYVNPNSTCPDSIKRLVKVYPRFRAQFADTGAQCPGAVIGFNDLSTATIKPVSFWKWYFGDGDSSSDQNPTHKYLRSGTYVATLISQNIKKCTDTAAHEVVIENFMPFAGHDTIIVKNESILFNAVGGIKYLWSPPTYLSDTTIYNPVGYFPDTGVFVYYVLEVSNYGCQGYDTIKVEVVSNAAFYVPNAFTPNGDGKNDIFRPIAIGYKNLNYFRIFNRWGEEVYFGTSLENGWDGTYKNKKAEMGTYYWEVSYTDRFGKKGSMKGDVTLVR